ncbi:MAG TPA: hypothetical protein VHO90_14715 [Bacteroidales bacterium]|nr:hypothetical protein [Bacteroidales bacterium]
MSVRLKKILFTLQVLMFCYALQGQACKDFHKTPDCYVYVPLDREFKIYNQAKSMTIKPLKPVIYKIILFGGKDYIVGVCAESKYYRKIRLRIFDGITKKLLYDNKDYDYIESFSFTVNKTQPLEMEVNVLADEKNSKSDICVGFQILYSDPLKK